MRFPESPRLQRLTRDAAATLARIAREHAPAVFASSFGAEDMVLLDLIVAYAPSIEVLSLDTGRLPRATHELIARVRERYPVHIRIVVPEEDAVKDYVHTYGVDGFYESVEKRRACCEIRKVLPLARALAGHHAWLTGLRRDQSPDRAEVPAKAFDAVHGIVKFNPLVEWTTEDVWTYIRAEDVPYNALHDRGYPSIGCDPCTRAIRPGEPLRAGRWWWEHDGAHKECGLHAVPIQVTSIQPAAGQGADTPP